MMVIKHGIGITEKNNVGPVNTHINSVCSACVQREKKTIGLVCCGGMYISVGLYYYVLVYYV